MHRPAIESTARPSDAEAPYIEPGAPGSGFDEGLPEQIERQRSAARETGRLLIKHPTRGVVMPVEQYEFETGAAQQLGVGEHPNGS